MGSILIPERAESDAQNSNTARLLLSAFYPRFGP
jgi:hypothetical protein